ncbi:MAG: N-acetylmuramoyl-L-alanine amidase [Patescibacteria group bacterium]
MKFVIAMVFGLTLLLQSVAHPQQKKGSLYGWVVVVDPGHGGADPGSSRILRGERVTENEYVYDVSLRVQRLIRERQGLALLTTKNGGGEQNASPSKIVVDRRDERFALDGTLVRAGKSGLSKRVEFGNQVSRRYPKHRQAWISIHFDVVGSSSDVQGIRIISADSSSRFVAALESTFRRVGRLREKHPVVESGDDAHGIRNLYVLRSVNRIKDRVLIELGNFLNDDDLWRIRNPEVRELYAKEIASALERY